MKLFMLVLAGLFWSALVLMFDGFMGYFMVKQIASSHYASITGQIVQSEVGKGSDSEGSVSYGIKIRYTYKVGERLYENKVYKYINYASKDPLSIANKIKDLPVDSEVTVFYRPSDPGDSVLSPGITEQDCFVPIFLLPFNVIMIFFWRAGFSMLHYRFRRPEAGGLEVIRPAGEVRLRLVRFSPFAYGLAAVGCAGVLGIILGAAASSSSTSLRFPIGTGLMIAVVGLWAGFHQKQKYTSGNYDLVIKKAIGKVILPMNPKEDRRRSLLLNDIVDIFVEENDDSHSEADPEYHNKIHLKDPERCEKICHWLGEEKSSELADWLSKELGVQRAPDRAIMK